MSAPDIIMAPYPRDGFAEAVTLFAIPPLAAVFAGLWLAERLGLRTKRATTLEGWPTP